MAFHARATIASRWLTLAVVSTLAWLPQGAQARRGGRSADIALFPLVTRGSPNAALVEALETKLADAAKESSAGVLSGAALSRRLRSNPSQAVSRCAGEASCLGKLARRAKVSTLVTGRVSEKGSGIHVTFFVVSAGRGRMESKPSITVATKDDIAAQLGSVFKELFGVAAPASLSAKPEPIASAEPSLEALGDLSLEPVPALEEPQVASAEPAPTAEPQPAAPPADALEVEPLPELPDLAALPPNVEEVPAAPADAATTAPSDEPPTETVAAGPRGNALFYAGAVTAAVGALTVAGGGYFGLKANSDYAQAKKTSETQVSANDLTKSGDSAVGRANLFFAVGGVALAAGAAMVGVDLYVLRPRATTEVGVEVGVAPGGASLLLHW